MMGNGMMGGGMGPWMVIAMVSWLLLLAGVVVLIVWAFQRFRPGSGTKAGEWPGVVERMRGHMKEMGKPVIPDSERDEIAGYLSRNARK